MQRSWSRCHLRYLVIIIYYYLSNLVLYGHAIESPQYAMVHSESDFEVRLYRESSWMSAFVPGTTSFENSTKDGFHRLYQYLRGANLNSSQLVMTAPVLTSINSSSLGSDYFVRIYISPNFAANPPQPNPELNLQFDKWTSHCVAVRKFTGFAKDDNIIKEVEALVSSLNKHVTGNKLADKSSYAVAQYNASYHLSGRLNEVWINVSGFTAEGCPSFQGEH